MTELSPSQISAIEACAIFARNTLKEQGHPPDCVCVLCSDVFEALRAVQEMKESDYDD